MSLPGLSLSLLLLLTGAAFSWGQEETESGRSAVAITNRLTRREGADQHPHRHHHRRLTVDDAKALQVLRQRHRVSQAPMSVFPTGVGSQKSKNNRRRRRLHSRLRATATQAPTTTFEPMFSGPAAPKRRRQPSKQNKSRPPNHSAEISPATIATKPTTLSRSATSTTMTTTTPTTTRTTTTTTTTIKTTIMIHRSTMLRHAPLLRQSRTVLTANSSVRALLPNRTRNPVNTLFKRTRPPSSVVELASTRSETMATTVSFAPPKMSTTSTTRQTTRTSFRIPPLATTITPVPLLGNDIRVSVPIAPAPSRPTLKPPSGARPPAPMPPSDNVVNMLNSFDGDFMELAAQLQLTSDSEEDD